MPALNLPGAMINWADPISRGLVRYWPMNEGAGSKIYDLARAESAYNIGAGVATWTGGRYGPGLLFPGSNHVVVTNPTAADLPSGASAKSMTILLRPSSISGGYHWGATMGSPAGSQTIMIGRNGSTLYGAFYANDLSVASFWAAERWAHIALTYDGATAFLYADGALLTSGAKTLNLVKSLFYIGNMVSGPEYWDGTVQHLRIYNRAIDAREVARLALDPLAGVRVSRLSRDLGALGRSSRLTADRFWRTFPQRVYRRGEV